jgi:hypothetical protein
MDKFGLFRLKDMAPTAGIALITSSLTIYAYSNGTTGAPLVMLIFVSLLFWLGLGVLVFLRKQYLNKISFISKHNLAIVSNGFPVKKDDVEAVIDSTIKGWYAASGWSGCADAIIGLWVFFDKYPVPHNFSQRNIAGYIAGDVITVGYLENMTKTALMHELGHKIHTAWTGVDDEVAAHKFMNAHNLS